jgi:folate-binding protein YgfZ
VIPLQATEIVAQANAAGFYTREPGLTVFEVRGKDGLDLLHRLSTNDLLSGFIPRSVNTVFTTEKGRIIDLAEVVVLENRILLIVHTGAAAKVKEWIDRFTILEEVELLQLTDDQNVYYILGSQIFSSRSMMDELRTESTAGAGEFCCWRCDLGGLPGMRCLVPLHRVARFTELQSHLGSTQLDGNAFELLRIMAAVPAYPNELNAGNHPLEVGLRSAVSFTKGCYVGQEVVARLDAYDKVKRNLLLLHVQGRPEPDVAPWHVSAGDKFLGECTSVSLPLTDDTTFALALCRWSELQGAPPALVVRGGGNEYEATIESPFWSGSPRGENR